MIRPAVAIFAGALLTVIIALVAAGQTAGSMSQQLSDDAARLIAREADGAVNASFQSARGYPSRHALLSPNGDVSESTRAKIARAVSSIPGVGGVHWTDGTMLAEPGEAPVESLRCQDDVAAILGARTLRFEESSAELAAGSTELLDEVAAALRPCFGARIAITGHTDSSGYDEANLRASKRRAEAVAALLEEAGADPERITIIAMGEMLATAPNAKLDGTPDEEGRAKNRRVEVSVAPPEQDDEETGKTPDDAASEVPAEAPAT